MRDTEPLGKDKDGTTDVAHPGIERVDGMTEEDVGESCPQCNSIDILVNGGDKICNECGEIF